jgi:hypothetical protein
MSEYGLHSGKIWSSNGQGVDRIRYDFHQIRIILRQTCVDSQLAGSARFQVPGKWEAGISSALPYISTEPGD